MLTGFLLLAAMAGALQQAPVTHYRITINSTRNVDRSSSGVEAVGGEYSAVAFVTASTTIQGSVYTAHVVVDSARCHGSGLMSMAFDTIVGKQSSGARYDFPLGSRLEVVPQPTVNNTLTRLLGQTALMLFPTVAPGANLGATWADSLDTTMGEQSDKNHPIVTRWKVAKVVGDTTIVEGDVRGALSSTGRMVGTELITGIRHLTEVRGRLSAQTSTVNMETLMTAAEGSTGVSRGTGTTSLEIVAIAAGRMTP